MSMESNEQLHWTIRTLIVVVGIISVAITIFTFVRHTADNQHSELLECASHGLQIVDNNCVDSDTTVITQ